ncbi:hypothetical protein [Tabrizicola sp.]|uniref:hypothetical protein n=1 Tax=Tabrizicola sp. TaxID=2005166 RepID=UPI002FDD6C09
MTRLVYALAASLALAAPVAADSLTVLLPTLTFPTDAVTTSTKGCDSTPTTCRLAE